VTRAREGHKAKLIQVVMEAAHQDARHAEWLLERQFPAEFASVPLRPHRTKPLLQQPFRPPSRARASSRFME